MAPETMSTYLFYDVETTGLNVAFDQVLHFAALRTDEQFNVVDEYDIRVQLRPDVIPAPEATITHGISVEEARDAPTTEVDAIRRIHVLMNEPGTTSIGYNSIGFDDEMLRFAFYRNLLTPYTHQYANGCGRMDLYPMAVMYWLAGSEALLWPTDEEGAFKLEQLARANHFDDHPDHRDHNARSDVRVTLELARAMAEDAERWDELGAMFTKDMDEAQMNALPTFDIGDESYSVALIIDGSFGPENNYQRPVIKLGGHRHYTNQSIWLALDTPALPGVASRPIRPNTEVIRRKLGVPEYLVPSGDDAYDRLDDRRRTIVQKNLTWLRKHPDQFQQIVGYYLESTYTKVPNLDPDAALYQQDFFTDEQKALFAEFHTLDSVRERARFVRRFDASHLRTLALRLIIRNTPQATWPDSVASYARSYMRHVDPHTASDVLIDHRGNDRRTPADALRDLDVLREQGFDGEPLTDDQRTLLNELEAYIKTQFDVYKSYRFA